MGDDSAGSSGAAQSASLIENEDQSSHHETTGLLDRVVSAFRSTPHQDQPAVISQPRQELVGLANLRSKRIEDVMVPRAEIVSVPENIKLDELVKVFRESRLSRLPVFRETLDTPTGMIHLKDLALKHGFNGNGRGGRFSIKRMIRPVLFVPPSMPIGVLLAKMQAERKHMALVIDEYGGVDGLVTIEDLIEQVLGEIEDEHDVDEADLWKQEKGGSYLAMARAPLSEFEAEIGQKLLDQETDEEVDTLGGLVFMLSGRVPARGEVIKHPAGPEFEIVDADPRKIKRLRVRLTPIAAE